MSILTVSTPTINFKRLKENIIALASIGKAEGGGIYRMAFTKEDYEARKWLMNKLQSQGIEAQLDGALNVIGRLNPTDKPAIVVGSHLDTVPNAGALDGALGVLIGLECMMCMHESGFPLKFPFELIAFSDEEGRFGGMFGSKSFAGMMTPGYLEEAVDLDGTALKDVLTQLGHDPYRALDAARTPQSIKYYLEVHIEQGPVLDQEQYPLGIVSDITGLFKWQITLTGESNHAGTTPMHLRKDAFMGLADFAHELPQIIEENGSDHSTMTIGKVNLLPGSPNTVPGQAVFSLDVRDTSSQVLRELQDASRKVLSAIARKRKLKFDFEELSWITPVACDTNVVNQFKLAAEKLNIPCRTLPSGAAHDAQMVAAIAPVGMLFVPSKGGVSHSPHEWTDWQDIESGANVLLQTLVELNKESEIRQ
jgi:beta-ureidopropionase / N-carbamoyl-L-amino-acid hydrolase